MTDIVTLPDNFIGKADRERLESFGGHAIARGRATRWHWNKDPRGAGIFEIYTGGPYETLAVCISRERKLDEFCVKDVDSRLIVTGTLDHVMAVVDELLARGHGESIS